MCVCCRALEEGWLELANREMEVSLARDGMYIAGLRQGQQGNACEERCLEHKGL